MSCGRLVQLLLLAILVLAGRTVATETENLGLSVLPARTPIRIDGDPTDWDLRGGIFICGNVETQRDKLALWFHAAYDAEHLYLLARWIDATPLDNPGSAKGSYGFNGDCLQFRIITSAGTSTERFSHWTCWRDKEGVSVAQITYGRDFKGGNADALKQGAQQAFGINDDRTGYTQEIAIPWSLLIASGTKPPATGDKLRLTVQPNFTVGGGRITVADLFREGVAVNRVFTHTASDCWGIASLESAAPEQPRPVRIADGRQFAVSLDDAGRPRIDWTGLIQSNEPRGFIPIAFDMPADGYVSLNLIGPDGVVARQLLNSTFYTRGSHRVMWDGLTTPSARQPGIPVPPGTYTWRAIWHRGIGVQLDGRVLDGDGSSWDAWGGDHGNPVAAAADRHNVYLGWASGEAGKPLMAVDPATGKPRWKNIRGGIAGARLIASDGEHVFAYNDVARYAAVAIYKLKARNGDYASFTAFDSPDLPIRSLVETDADAKPTGLAARAGALFVSIAKANRIVEVDATSGNKRWEIEISAPGDLEAIDDSTLLAISGQQQVVRTDRKSSTVSSLIQLDLPAEATLSALAVDKASIYVAVRGGGHDRIHVYDHHGKPLRQIGRERGRVLAGPWVREGLRNVAGMATDLAGRLWVAEDDSTPRRVTVWNPVTGELEREYFGPSSYGAMGGVINPVDPNLMIAQGCEWRIDPATGRAMLVGVVHRQGIANARFGTSADGRLFLATTHDALKGMNPVHLYERIGDADYRLRTTIWREGKTIKVWSDANDDQQRQDDEIRSATLDDYDGWITGWYMPMTPDLTFYGANYVLAVTGYTACGAPIYDPSKAKRLEMPEEVKRRTNLYARRGHGSVDGTLMLYNGQYNTEHSTFECHDIATGRRLWSYPNNYVGVHGSHKAIGPAVGLVRGAFDIVGAAKLPEPIGNLFVIPTNKGEWHLLTGDGFYLARLFEGDPLSMRWPEKPLPGAILDQTPPGAGEEAFGGSITQAHDGTLYLTVGHTSYWKTHVTGLDTVKELARGQVTVSPDDTKRAEVRRAELIQADRKPQRWTLRRQTPTFKGSLRDIAGQPITFARQPGAAISVAGAWDDQNLYLAWEVKDDTPWINGADAPEFVYARGDSVDLQLDIGGGTRVTIAPFKGKPVAVAYSEQGDGRPVQFRSGVVEEYVMRVREIDEARITVTPDKAKRSYVVQAAIPLKALGLTIKPGQILRGDVGALHSNAAGNDTALRSYWNNLHTGIVSDEVYELKLDPTKWGELVFAP